MSENVRQISYSETQKCRSGPRAGNSVGHAPEPGGSRIGLLLAGFDHTRQQQVFTRRCEQNGGFCAGESGSPSAKRATDDLLRLLYDGGEMLGIFQALGVEFVDVLRARRTCRKPAAGRDNLQPANRGGSSGSSSESRRDRLTSEFCSGDVFRREFL